MNCEEISELLPAYVLGALEPDELEAIEEHLRAGREHDQELVELRATVFAMDRYHDDAVPSPPLALAARVRGIVEPPSVATMPTRPRPRHFLLPDGLRTAAAAVAVLLVFAAGVLAGGAITGDRGEALAFVLQGEGGALMEVRGSTSQDSVTVTMAGLDRLSGGSYQVWAIRDGKWLSIGVCNTNAEGAWVGDFAFQLQNGEQVALTIEALGGSEGGPTGEPLLRSAY